jgi:hypothetical protein
MDTIRGLATSICEVKESEPTIRPLMGSLMAAPEHAG